ncbi:hypothetical protein SK128_004771 [Halocaridina rubra]|uniref:Uncharacterized protein n=1 Tax=Halocaridina rubra TaxID=373956 RepID=A0AAN8XDM5_HALRR
MNLEWLHKYEEPAVQRGSLLALVEDHPPVKKMVDFADHSIPPYEEEEEGREKDLVEPIVGNEKETEEQLQCGCYDEADQVKPDPQRKALKAKIAIEQLKRKTKTQKKQILETLKMCQAWGGVVATPGFEFLENASSEPWVVADTQGFGGAPRWVEVKRTFKRETSISSSSPEYEVLM